MYLRYTEIIIYFLSYIFSMFKIGLTIWSIGLTSSYNDLLRQLELAIKIGVEGVQLWCVDYGSSLPCLLDPYRCDVKCRKRVEETIDSYGLKITGFCAQLSSPNRFGGFDDPEGIEKRIEKTKRALELSVDMGSPIVTTHPGVIPENKDDKRYNIIFSSIKEIAKFAENIGAYFCIETGMEPINVLKDFILEINSDGLKVNFDPANLLRYGVDEIVNGVRVLSNWIIHTHAKDYNPKTRKATVGKGLVPWKNYLKELKNQGYKGWLVLEDETGKNVVESLMEGREFLEKAIKNLV